MGQRDEARPPLEESLQRFRDLARCDGEAFGHLFLASVATNSGETDEAERHLREAIPLFRGTGHGAGLATALRNLAELEAARCEHREALAAYAEAAPLVRRLTMRFLDEDESDLAVAPSVFFAQHEDVVKLDLAEAFRANAAQHFGNEDQQAIRGTLPDELLAYLAHQTLNSRSRCGGAADEWRLCLEQFVEQMNGLGPSTRMERELAPALFNLATGQTAKVDPNSP